ncbi:MazG nucleotide pyrophosphohydrolase domain-containing protein, partial [Candidatus Kryptonium thompsonii]
SVMAEESGKFTLAEVIEGIRNKLIYRHPHVFGDVKVDNSKEVKHNWEKLKQAENNRDSIISGIPKSLHIEFKRKREALASIGKIQMMFGKKLKKKFQS